MAILFGKATNTMDAKGRVSIPARFREALGEKFYIMEGLINDTEANCLVAVSEERFNKMAEELGEPDILDVNRQYFVDRLYGSTIECTLDSHGRVLLPAGHREYAQLLKEVLFVGARDRVNLWNEENYAEYQQRMLSRQDELIKDVNARKHE